MNPGARAQAIGWNDAYARIAAYRPFDRRWHYSHPFWNDRPRPKFLSVWGADNLCLFSLPGGTNAGPASWCYSSYPDRHAFRGSYGGYAFPLHDRRPEVAASNVTPSLIAGLSAAYGEAVAPEDVFDFILCFLSARAYSRRFAEDLEDTFPHVAFPADGAIFADGVRLGREIRELESFARAPRGAFETDGFVRLESPPRGPVAEHEPVNETLDLCADGSGRTPASPRRSGPMPSAATACCHVGWKPAPAGPPIWPWCANSATSVGALPN
jgi:hypothetical protein